MFVEFSITNFRSIASTQAFSMSAGKHSSEMSEYSAKTGHPFAPSVLRVTSMFGANGSGKSSFIKGIDFFQDFVRDSAKENTSKIPVEPHVYDPSWKDSPSTFEVVFIFHGRLCQYGFSADESKVYDEWMYVKESNPTSRMKRVFTRSYSEENKEYDWNISRDNLSGDKDVWRRSTRDNALFLSTSVLLNSEDLKEPYEYIVNKIKLLDNLGHLTNGFSIKRMIEGEQHWKNDILSFLSNVDIKIDDIKVEIGAFDPERDIPKDIPAGVAKTLVEQMKDTKIVHNLDTLRKDIAGNSVSLPLSEESSGTQVLFALAAPIADVLKEGFTLIIDEMYSTLHPLAVRYLVSLFNDATKNRNGAQLIFTGHETSVMEQGIMHSDQVWLVEKGKDLSTNISPVSKFKSRDILNIRKSYMTGRLGAVPLITSKDLFPLER